jgi:hypothetical protein
MLGQKFARSFISTSCRFRQGIVSFRLTLYQLAGPQTILSSVLDTPSTFVVYILPIILRQTYWPGPVYSTHSFYNHINYSNSLPAHP